jgi:ketosteroid isomerase-like protein
MSELRTASLGCRNETEETSVQTVCRVATRKKNIHCIASLLVAAFLCASMICAQDQPKFSPAQQEVLNASQAKRDARNRRDIATWAKYVADDCVFSDDDGVLVTKAQLMEFYEKRPIEYDHSTNSRDFVVRLHGNTAVVNSRGTVHEQFGDTEIISEQRATETWVKENGYWLMIASQWGNLPVNFRKPVSTDTSVYKDYVGQYEWRPLVVETISVKDGKLWSHFGQDEDEYLPLGSETFFVKSDLGSATFVRDAQGHITGYTYHRVDGQEIHVKKIK